MSYPHQDTIDCLCPDCERWRNRPHPSDPPNNVTDEIRATTAPPAAGFAPIDRELAEARFKESLTKWFYIACGAKEGSDAIDRR